MKGCKSASSPLLFVLGTEHADAERCIKTLVEKYADNVQDTVSVGTGSPTKRCSRHLFKLNGEDVELVDANESITDCDSDQASVSEETLLKLLEQTGKGPLYPPLVILRAPNEKHNVYLECIRSVFPSIVCAICCSKAFFATVADGFLHSTLYDVPLFHIDEVVDAEHEDGTSRALYDEVLEKIYDQYNSLTPTRDELNFDSQLFEGDYEQVKIRTEIDAEDRKKDELVTGLEDRETKRRRVVRFNRSGYKKLWTDMNQRERNLAFRYISEVIGSFLREDAWVPLSEEEVVEPSEFTEMESSYRRIVTVRSHFERDVHDVYKVLINGIRIYCGEVEEEWRETGDEVIHEEYVRVPPS